MNLPHLIANRFSISDLLGRGGMGEVYRAANAQTGETVAVKVLNPEIVDPELLERFQREGEALRQLNHPNIVRFVAAVEEGGQHFLVMEYVSGGSLEDLLAKQGRLPYAQAAEIALDLADALTRAHRLGILHRDLKPANVLLDASGAPKLADFGIAYRQSTPHLTQTGVLVGTVDYLSPEACQGQPHDERSDIWAFGVLLFQMLSGRLPFEGANLTARITAILTKPTPDLAQLVPEVPDALADLAYRMLEKDPQQRMPSVRLVGAELEDILKGRVPAAPSRAATSRFASPAPAPDRLKDNLPAQATPLVGREAELQQLACLLADPDTRLVTILGPGGMGKTRLALEASREQVVRAADDSRFRDGVCFVSLAPVQSAEVLVPTVAAALSIPTLDDSNLRQILLDALSQKRLLLILDNCEHLLEGLGLVGEILAVAPGVKVLATSRARLNLQSETLFHLGGMDFPQVEILADALPYSAVRLFVQSARRARPGFQPLVEDWKSIVHICKLVGGMPLGILLAAAWSQLLTPAEIAAEIAGGVDFFETQLQDVPDRQRSLRTVFDFSWNQLAEREQEIFQALTIFEGGFSREAAQVVTGASLRDLIGLAEKSLIHRSPTGRYTMHELLRQYGKEKLIASASAAAVRQRHAETYLGLAKQFDLEYNTPNQAEWFHRIGREMDNCRAALDWCLQSGSVETGLRLAGYLGIYWSQVGPLTEGRRWLERFLDAAPAPTALRAKVLDGLGVILWKQGNIPSAYAVLTEQIGLAESLGDRSIIARATFHLAWPLISLGENDHALGLLERSYTLYLQEDRIAEAAHSLLIMGEHARIRGDLERARELDEQALTLCRRLDHKLGVALATGNLGMVLIHFNELDRCQALLQESLSIFLAVGSQSYIIGVMGFAFLANARGDPIRATRLLSAARAIGDRMDHAVDAGDRLDYEANLASLQSQLGNDGFEAAWAEGQALTFEQAIALALGKTEDSAT